MGPGLVDDLGGFSDFCGLLAFICVRNLLTEEGGEEMEVL